MTMPFCSHGVSTVSWAMCTGGSARTSLDSGWPVADEHRDQLDQGGRGVVGGQEARPDEAAGLAGGERDVRWRPATSIRWADDSLV